jgi:hypothetical protein
MFMASVIVGKEVVPQPDGNLRAPPYQPGTNVPHVQKLVLVGPM